MNAVLVVAIGIVLTAGLIGMTMRGRRPHGGFIHQYKRTGSLWSPGQLALCTRQLMEQAGLDSEQDLPEEAFWLWDNEPIMASVPSFLGPSFSNIKFYSWVGVNK